MSESANFTLEDYRALNAAIAQGALIVEYGDKKLQYRTLDEMIRLRNLMARELGLIKKGSNRRIGVFSKNWDDECN